MAFERLKEMLNDEVKGLTWEHVRDKLMSNPEVQAAYEAEARKERLQAMLTE